MKLRNKKTGEIRNCQIMADGLFVINSIADLNDWEDYEEPEDYWYIDSDGKLLCEPSDDRCEFDNNCREIGNYFETKEEAEKAVEKLKAWKRLKDAGVRFDECRPEYQNFEILYVIPERPVKEYDQIFADIYLLFGGEE